MTAESAITGTCGAHRAPLQQADSVPMWAACCSSVIAPTFGGRGSPARGVGKGRAIVGRLEPKSTDAEPRGTGHGVYSWGLSRRQVPPISAHGITAPFVLTAVRNAVPNDRVRAYAVWEGWHGYDRRRYGELLRDGFRPFELAIEGARKLQIRGATC